MDKDDLKKLSLNQGTINFTYPEYSYGSVSHGATELADLRASRDRWRDAEQRLSSAYLRLRNLIPGALNTPAAPSPEEVWEITENALKVLLEENKQLKEELEELYESGRERSLYV